MNSNWWFSKVTIPTHITLVRIVLIPFIVKQLLAHNMLLALILFGIAALTDIVDGALARYMHATSELGAFLDPLADKLLLISCYACLAYTHFSFAVIPVWFLLFVIVSEFILVAGSIYGGMIKKNINIQATKLGKMASFIQILFIAWLFACSWVGTVPQGPLFVLLMLIFCMRIWVFIHYALRAFYGEKYNVSFF